MEDQLEASNGCFRSQRHQKHTSIALRLNQMGKVERRSKPVGTFSIEWIITPQFIMCISIFCLIRKENVYLFIILSEYIFNYALSVIKYLFAKQLGGCSPTWTQEFSIKWIPDPCWLHTLDTNQYNMEPALPCSSSLPFFFFFLIDLQSLVLGLRPDWNNEHLVTFHCPLQAASP